MKNLSPNTCLRCGGWKAEKAKMCWNCRWEAQDVVQVPVEPADPVKEAMETIIRVCIGRIS
jgi:hypothetical protein